MNVREFHNPALGWFLYSTTVLVLTAFAICLWSSFGDSFVRVVFHSYE